MATPNTNYDDILTSTLRLRSEVAFDNMSNHNALLRRLKKNGNIKKLKGGTYIVENLRYQENANFKNYSGYETLDVTPSNILTAAEFSWKQCGAAVTISGLELRQNAESKTRILDLMETRILNTEETMFNQVSTQLYSAGTDSKAIGGLQLLVPDDPTTGTVGGINRATAANAFWRSKLYDFSVAGATPGSATIQTAMINLWLQTVRGIDKPDLIVADNLYWTYYWQSLTANQRFVNEDDSASAGFKALEFMQAPVIFDTGGGCPASHMYFLNTKYIYFKVHQDANFAPLDERQPVNQDAIIKPIILQSNMTLSNAARQGVIIA